MIYICIYVVLNSVCKHLLKIQGHNDDFNLF